MYIKKCSKWIINWQNIIYIPESQIEAFCFCKLFCLIGVKEKIDRERNIVCSHGDAYDLLKNVASELDKYVFDKELLHTGDLIFCVWNVLLRAWQNKLNSVPKL